VEEMEEMEEKGDEFAGGDEGELFDVALVETEELIAELSSRFDHAIFAGMRINEHGERAPGFVRAWEGNTHTCVGLAVDLEQVMIASFREGETAE